MKMVYRIWLYFFDWGDRRIKRIINCEIVKKLFDFFNCGNN